jgi:pimeloyl-ACP methyl ester carboxylesterase
MRTLRLVIALSMLLPAQAASQAQPTAETVVLVHGAWGGGWDWKGVERELRSRGYDVYRATLTGQGERHHLISPEVGLETHISDVANLIVWEQLDRVVLVGHSYGGMVITGVTERIPDRIGRLVYLDAMLPFDGECVMGMMGGQGEGCGDVESVRGQSDGVVPPSWLEPGTLPPHDVPHPARTLVDPLHLQGDPGHGRPASYILTRDEPGEPDGFDWAAERAGELGWPVMEMIADHNPQRTKPAELVDLILTTHSGDPGR